MRYLVITLFLLVNIIDANAQQNKKNCVILSQVLNNPEIDSFFKFYEIKDSLLTIIDFNNSFKCLNISNACCQFVVAEDSTTNNLREKNLTHLFEGRLSFFVIKIYSDPKDKIIVSLNQPSSGKQVGVRIRYNQSQVLITKILKGYQ